MDEVEVTVAWETSQGEFGSGPAIEISDDNSRYWFFVDESYRLDIQISAPRTDAERIDYKIFCTRWIDLEVEITFASTKDRTRRSIFRNSSV